MGALFKSALREIKNSLGRYFAVLIIIALGVGFFAGLRACRPAMTSTVGAYYDSQRFYDYCFASTVGFSKDCADGFENETDVSAVEGAIYEDALISSESGDVAIRIHSITENVNLPCLVSGRMPNEENECLVDAKFFDEDMLGKTVTLSDSNNDETLKAFTSHSFLIVGRITSPLYINSNRGRTSLGDGKIEAFLFVDEKCFTADYYKELYVLLKDRKTPYSNDYDELISTKKTSLTELAEEEARLRYEKMVSDAQQEIDDARIKLNDAATKIKQQKDAAIEEAKGILEAMGQSATPDNPYYIQMMSQIDEAFAEAESEIANSEKELADAQQEIDSLEPPTVYAMTRAENAGYVAFEKDSTIIENISIVFPAFFFLVAALVCVTTMTRMVEEQRTQIGVLKALGYGKGKIYFKFLFYAGSAGLIGSVFGFFVGTVLIPKVFWFAYSAIYNFSDSLLYFFDPLMFSLSIIIPMLCTLGVTVLCCKNAMREVPASILRPKTPKSGKRIWIERLKIWKRVSFLHKVSVRNVIRYKQRFFLMILGISGCTALLLAGFGIRDSIQNVTDYQYGEITLYDGEITFLQTMDETAQKAFLSRHECIDSALFSSVENVDITFSGKTKDVSLTAVPEGSLSSFINLRSNDVPISYPKDGEIILCKGIAEKLDVKYEDTVTLKDDSLHMIDVIVSGIFDNYIGDYLFVTEETMISLSGEAPINTAYFRFTQNGERNISELQGDEQVSYLALNSDKKESIETSLSSLNLVLLLIILCAGALAFIVLFNLININIRERIREIATIKVLGFFPRETAAYVFREVNILTIAGTLLGLLFGKLLHLFAMQQIRPDGMCYDIRISAYSYLLSIAITILFAVFVQLVMRIRLKKISMVESLKSVE